MNGIATPDAWIERYRQALAPGVIKARAETKGTAVPELGDVETEVACLALRHGLEAVNLVSDQMEAIIRGEIERALAHAIHVYSDPQAALRAAYGTSQPTAAYMPTFITGLAGAGKSRLRVCIQRVLSGRRLIVGDEAHPKLPLIDYVDCVIYQQKSLIDVLRPLASKEIAECRVKVSQARLPVECARWQRLCGICLLGVDELQFMAASDTATTLITQTMLAIAEVRIPWFVTANYSLARKLLSRPSEAIQRLLGHPVVVLPDAPGSTAWEALLTEYQVVLTNAVSFDLLEYRAALWNFTAGMKRELVKLLIHACRVARRAGAVRADWVHVQQAFGSVEFSASRNDINLLIAHAGQGGNLRTDLSCPFEGLQKSSGGDAYSQGLSAARQRQVAAATVESAMSAAEKSIFEALRNGTPAEAEPTATPRVARPRRQSLESLTDAGRRMRERMGREPKT